jgi:hypothetical protein
MRIKNKFFLNGRRFLATSCGEIKKSGSLCMIRAYLGNRQTLLLLRENVLRYFGPEARKTCDENREEDEQSAKGLYQGKRFVQK